MKKTMTKVFALVLVLAMVIGFVAMIPAQAATDDSVQFVAHNVYFDDYLQIMYAVYVPDGTTVEKIVLSDGTNEFSAELFEDENAAPTYNGKECARYVAVNGVALQNIDTVITAKAYVNGAVVAEDEYSIAQYLHKRLVVDNATEDQDAMYLSLLDAAEKMQTVINDSVTLHDTSYVNVINGTVDGTNAEGMVATGTTLANVTTDLVAGEGQEIEWTVTEYTDAGEASVPLTVTTEQVQALVVENGVNLVLEAGLKDADAPEEVWSKVTDASALAAGDNIVIVAKDYDVALSTTQNSNNRGQADVIKTVDTVTFGSDVQILTLETGTVSGTFAFNTGSGYLYAASSSSNHLKTQTDKDGEASWTITIDGEGAATITAQGENTRNLLQYNQSSKLFSCYGSATQKAVVIYKLSGGTTVEPSEPDVTEPDVTEPDVTEPSTEPSEPDTTTPGVEAMEHFSYTFSSITGSTQYAKETWDLGSGVTLDIENCHINTQLRIYSSSSNNGVAVFTLPGIVNTISFNAGNKADTLNVYGSTDGVTWTLIEGVSVSSSYKDYTVNIENSEYTYIKLDVQGTQQVRVTNISFN